MSTDAETQQAIINLVGKAAVLIAEGKSKAEVVSEFVAQGVPQDLAKNIATKGEEVKKAEFRKGGQTTMLIGAGLAGLGIAITAGTYSAASSGGGHYVITYGLIIYGIWIFLKGLWRTAAG